MRGENWVIIDTETDGLFEPIHVVEIAAQRMHGWDTDGEPFRVLLDHQVPIPREATAIHGYTQEFLAQNGNEPVAAHEAFRAYVGDAPLVAHNLSYDWNRALVPEWQRLGLPEAGQRGFCTIMLSRRAAGESPSHGLEALKQFFSLNDLQGHRALNDVRALVELCAMVFRPRFEAAGLNSFDAVAAFAKRTPVAKCRAMLREAMGSSPVPPQTAGPGYYLDDAHNVHGPHTAADIAALADGLPPFVWQEGLSDWAAPTSVEEFATTKRRLRRRPVAPLTAAAIELVGLCRGLVADGRVTTAEVKVLASWLEQIGSQDDWPIPEIAQLVERILEDGVVTMAEKEELQKLIEQILRDHAFELSTPASDPQPAQSGSGITVSAGHYERVGMEQGTESWIRWRHSGIGASDAPAIMGENPWKSRAELLRHKRGPAKSLPTNQAMRRGIELEPKARRAYIAQTGRHVAPACLQSLAHPWMRASVDGLSECGRFLVEFKCGATAYDLTATSMSPPDYYYGQLQHLLALTCLEQLDYCCFWPGLPEIVLSVRRDDDYIARLVAAEEAFWREVRGDS